MIEATEISKSYSRGKSVVHAVRDVSFQIPDGAKVALLGRSGSGKTTLLNLLAGLHRTTSGKLSVDDLCLSECSPRQLDGYRKRGVGIVFQQFRLIRHRTAAQNVELPLLLDGVDAKTRRKKIEESLERVGLQDRARHFPSELSGGEQQRVAIARALVNKSNLLLADEPTGNLDSANSDLIFDLLEQIHEESNTTLVLVTHDEQLAIRMTDKIIRMSDGQVVENTIGGTEQ